MENVVLLTVTDPGRAYQALSELHRLSDDGAVELRGAAIIERDPDGRWSVPEAHEEGPYTGALTGGAIGAVIGALMGPAGLLLGGAAGFVVGSAADIDEAETIDMVLLTFPRRVAPGSTAVVADVDEPTPDVLNAVLRKFGTVERLARVQVEAELAAAAEAAEAEHDEAERIERERRRAAGQESLADRFAALKDRVLGEAR